MVPRIIDTAGTKVQSGRNIRSEVDRPMKYRLDVIASTVDEVVSLAGGLLFDRAVAGWQVIVTVADCSDDRPLRILGAETLDLESALASAPLRPTPQMLAVAIGLFGSDSRVREGVLKAFHDRGTEVVFLGETRPEKLDHSVGLVQYRLSAAARAFKTQALAAATTPTASVGFTEMLMTKKVRRSSSAADLTPVG